MPHFAHCYATDPTAAPDVAPRAPHRTWRYGQPRRT